MKIVLETSTYLSNIHFFIGIYNTNLKKSPNTKMEIGPSLLWFSDKIAYYLLLFEINKFEIRKQFITFFLNH